MEIAGSELRSQSLDHLGLVAAICQDLQIAEKIDQAFGPQDSRRVVSPGIAVEAMILNGLGFSNHRLYLTPKFFKNKPIEKLLGIPLKSSDLNDDTLGKTLDQIHKYGTTQLFGEIAFRIAQEQGLLSSRNNLDSTSLSLNGKYSPSQKEEEEGSEEIRITQGFSKDHRPDLKQVMFSLVMNGESKLPLWMEAQDGNTSDKVSFHETIKRVEDFKKQWKRNHHFRWVADSALYNQDALLSQNNYLWTSRVPETIKEAKELVEKAQDELEWSSLDGSSDQMAEWTSDYGGIQQRWILIYSPERRKKEEKTLEKQWNRKKEVKEKELKKLEREVFSCEEDAQQAIKVFQKKSKEFLLEAKCVSQMKYPRKGRPKKEIEKVCVGYKIQGALTRNEELYQKKLGSKGKFILATNNMDQESYPSQDIYKAYKTQQGVERGFRFIKDPWFMRTPRGSIQFF